MSFRLQIWQKAQTPICITKQFLRSKLWGVSFLTAIHIHESREQMFSSIEVPRYLVYSRES